MFFFFNDPATTEIYTLSLHDALPICIQPSVLHITNDADDCAGEVVDAESHPFADRVFIGKEAAGHRFVDYENGWRVWPVALTERASSDERDSQRIEIVRSDEANTSAGRLARREFAPFNIKSKVHVVASQREKPGRGYRLHTRQRFTLFDQSLEKGRSLRARISDRRQWQLHCQEVIHLETGVDALQTQEALNHEGRADQQDQ